MIDQLPQQQKEIIQLKFDAGLSYKEIGKPCESASPAWECNFTRQSKPFAASGSVKTQE